MNPQKSNFTMLTTYEDAVGVALASMKVDDIFIIEEKVKPENREKFIGIVKNYIDKDFLHTEKEQIEFNSNYAKLRKTIYICR